MFLIGLLSVFGDTFIRSHHLAGDIQNIFIKIVIVVAVVGLSITIGILVDLGGLCRCSTCVEVLV
jgi:hypothetical protein